MSRSSMTALLAATLGRVLASSSGGARGTRPRRAPDAGAVRRTRPRPGPGTARMGKPPTTRAPVDPGPPGSAAPRKEITRDTMLAGRVHRDSPEVAGGVGPHATF